jgi:hypothetical protein
MTKTPLFSGRTLLMVDRSHQPNYDARRQAAHYPLLAWRAAQLCDEAVLVAYNSTITAVWSHAQQPCDVDAMAADVAFTPVGGRATDSCTRIADQFFGPFARVIILTTEQPHWIADVDTPITWHTPSSPPVLNIINPHPHLTVVRDKASA